MCLLLRSLFPCCFIFHSFTLFKASYPWFVVYMEIFVGYRFTGYHTRQMRKRLDSSAVQWHERRALKIRENFRIWVKVETFQASCKHYQNRYLMCMCPAIQHTKYSYAIINFSSIYMIASIFKRPAFLLLLFCILLLPLLLLYRWYWAASFFSSSSSSTSTSLSMFHSTLFQFWISLNRRNFC